ncbi:MAG: ABC transporter substrate-binding protein [Synechococcus sp.]
MAPPSLSPPRSPLLATLAGLLVLLGGCGGSRPGGTAQQLVVGFQGTIDTVDPAQATTVGALQLLSAVGDPLYAIRADGALEPRLATALPTLSSDGLRAVIPLRQGVRFHDGTPFDAEAMAFSLRRFLAIGKLSYVVGDRIRSVRVLDSHHLELVLSRPYGALPQLLTSASLTPVSPRAYWRHRDRFLPDAFVGTGPYRLGFTSPQLQRLEPFAGYWGPAPRNAGLALASLTTSSGLLGALRSGQVDVLLSTSLQPDHQRALHRKAAAGRLREGRGPALEIGYITLLSDRPPLQDPRLRRALALSLDRPLLTARVSDGLRPPLRGLVPPSLLGALATWPSHDIAAARRLLRQAGWCQGRPLELSLTYRSNVPSDRLFALTWQEALRRDLPDCLRLTLTGMESTTAYRQLGDGAFQMILLDWIGDFPDADNYLMPLLACDRAVGNRCLEGASASSGSFWAAPGLQEQLVRTETLTGPERLPVLHQVQQQVAAASPYIPVWSVQPRAWARPGISPPRFDGSGRLLLSQLSREVQP